MALFELKDTHTVNAERSRQGAAFAAKEVEAQGKGGVLAAQAAEAQGEGSGSTRQRRCLRREGGASTGQRRCLSGDNRNFSPQTACRQNERACTAHGKWWVWPDLVSRVLQLQSVWKIPAAAVSHRQTVGVGVCSPCRPLGTQRRC